MPLTDIRKSCEEIIDALAPICIRLDSRGSLVRVQHIAFAGLACISMGRMNSFWEHISCATRVAQQIGLHLDISSWPSDMNEIEKEMRRRTFCNLYIWDRYVGLMLFFGSSVQGICVTKGVVTQHSDLLGQLFVKTSTPHPVPT